MQDNNEFSRPVTLEELLSGPFERHVEATAEERRALAARFGLRELGSLKADLSIRPSAPDGDFRLEGRLSADVVQVCVVSLEPVAAQLEETFTLRYRLGGDPAAEAQETDVLVDMEEEDPPESVGPAGIDVGEAVAQQLAVALDPYPRASGVDFEAVAGALAAQGKSVPRPDPSGPDETTAGENPFAVLANLKRKN